MSQAAPDLPTAPAAGSARRRQATALAMLSLATALGLWSQRALLTEHVQAWRSPAAAATLRLATLSAAMDEAGLRQHYAGLAWQCAGSATQRHCSAPLTEADGVAVAGLQADFAQGHLRALHLRLPWWRHHAMLRMLVDGLSAPDQWAHWTPAGGQVGASQDSPTVIIWRLPGGSLSLPRAPGLHPLRWVELRWTAQVSGG